VHEIAKIRGEDVDPMARTLRVTGKGNVTAVLPLHLVLVVVAGLGFMWSLFAMMITDRCSGAVPECSGTLMTVAYAVAWGGIGLAGVVAYQGVRRAVARHRVAFIWPCVGLLIVVASLACGAMLLNSAVGL
jgi:hypothetical protein